METANISWLGLLYASACLVAYVMSRQTEKVSREHFCFARWWWKYVLLVWTLAGFVLSCVERVLPCVFFLKPTSSSIYCGNVCHGIVRCYQGL